jgi:hypothetical protein
MALLENAEVPPQTADFIRAIAERNPLLLTQVLAPMEKWKRDQVIPMVTQWLELAESALACRAGLQTPFPLARQLAAARSSPDLMKAVDALKKGLEYLQGNISPAAVCGWLTWELR